MTPSPSPPRTVKYLHKNQVQDVQLFLLNETLVCGKPKTKKEHKYKFLFQVRRLPLPTIRSLSLSLSTCVS